MAKTSSLFMCSSCGNEFPKWSGQCPACKQWNALSQVTSFTRPYRSSSKSSSPIKPISPKKALNQIKTIDFPTHISELDRVLGQGIIQGGIYLIAGQPGIGKSTLITQLALKLSSASNKKSSILYVCSEENPSQVALRINRLKSSETTNLDLLDTSSVESILDVLSRHSYQLIIIDSIQSVSTDLNPSTPGSPSQIRDSANLFIKAAKTSQTPFVLVGHVTKAGDLAGPKILEHMVDTVLELSGDKQHNLRLLRSRKNRFGPTDETGLFEMTSKGLKEIKDPSKFLLEGRLKNSPGSALALVMEGTRPLTVEVQALVVPSNLPIPRRISKGIRNSRLQLICAILTKHLHLSLHNKDVFLNVTGGMNIKEPGADLAIALSIISSAKNKPLPDKSISFGELGLLGEVRSVSFQDKRLKEAKTLGYTKIYSLKNTSHLKKLNL